MNTRACGIRFARLLVASWLGTAAALLGAPPARAQAPPAVPALKDPTRPPEPASAAVKPRAERIPPPRVSAIFIANNRRIAIFNDQPVHEGDRVGAYRIDEISEAGVKYFSAGKNAFAPLGAPLE